MPFPLFFLLAAALGTRESIANRRDKKTALDLEAERINAINNIDLGLDAQGIANKFDARQIRAMQEQFQTGQGLLKSKDLKLQALGAGMLSRLDSAIRQNIQQNETEARADAARLLDQEIVEAGAGKAANEKRFERALVMNRQLNEELQPFGAAQLGFNKVMNLLKNDDQLASLAGLTAFVQSIDDSVVRESELLKYQGANGLITQIVNLVNKSEGRDFDPTTKQSLRNASAALMNAQKTQAVTIVNSFQARAISFALDVEKVLSGIDGTLFTQIPIDRATEEVRQAQADAAEAAFTAAPEEFEEIEPSGVARAGAKGIAVVQEIMRATGMLIRGSKMIKDKDGNLFELTVQGEVIPIEEAEILRASRQNQQDVIDATSGGP